MTEVTFLGSPEGPSELSIRPKRIHGESLNSLVVRTSYANMTEPRRIVRPYSRGSVPDFDVLQEDSAIAEKIPWANQPYRPMTLWGYEGTSGRNKHGLLGLDWLVKPFRLGLLFCPLCLRNEPQLFRLSWRIAVAPVCIIHKVLLAECCPGCHHPVDVFRSNGKRRIGVCGRCQCELAEAKVQDIEGAPGFELAIVVTQIMEGTLTTDAIGWKAGPSLLLFYLEVFRVAKLLPHLAEHFQSRLWHKHT